jgi:hypothetical protein
MEVKLTLSELKDLQDAKDSNLVRRYMAAKPQLEFEVGDVLIKKYSHYTSPYTPNKWITESISNSNKMAQRYVVIHKDEYDIIYIKRMRVKDATLSSDVIALTSFDFNSCMFQVDPEFAETVFLGGEFDLKNLHKQSLEARKNISKVNRKIGKKSNSLKELNDFFAALKSGAKFWTTQDYTAQYVTEYEFINAKIFTVSKLDKEGEYDWRRFKARANPSINTNNEGDKVTAFIDDAHSLKIFYKSGSAMRENDGFSYEFSGHHGYILYSQKPAQEDKK